MAGAPCAGRLLGGAAPCVSIDAPSRGGGTSNQLAVAMSSDSIVSVVEVWMGRCCGGVMGVTQLGSSLLFPFF